MNRWPGVALVAFVIWAAIAVIGANLTICGTGSRFVDMTSGVRWTWLAAAAFILWVALRQGWQDVGLNRWTHAAG